MRRTRKALLSDLSALVKTAKKLQECTAPGSQYSSEDINTHVDNMLLQAFKIVTRGVRFLDVYDEEVKARQSTASAKTMPTVIEESYVPPTPPAEKTSFGHQATASDASSRRTSFYKAGIKGSMQGTEEKQTRQSYHRMSSSYSGAVRPRSLHIKRSSVSHRVSTTGPACASQRAKLVSERLGASHDSLLSYLGSFIGRLHLQSQSPGDLLLTTRQSISAGRGLLTIVETVCLYDTQSEATLYESRDVMYHCINQLITAVKECVRPVGLDEYEIMSSQETTRLKDAATDCVVAAGDCVAKTKFVIERIGDFELETQTQGLGIDIAAIGEAVGIEHTRMDSSQTIQAAEDASAPPEPSARPPPPPTEAAQRDSIMSIHKPLPSVPSDDAADDSDVSPLEAPPNSTIIDNETTPVPRSSVRSLLPPLPKLTSPIVFQDSFQSSNSSPTHDGDFQQLRSDSIAVSSSGTSSSYLSSMRDSESSLMSQTSTRATTPDVVPYIPSHQQSFSSLSLSETATGSQVTLADEVDEAESKMLEKTFAHELLHNKEGHITGGTLPALIERLTTHDSTPDAMFVSTFYLTFRLFVTPAVFAEALIDRFDYVSESPHIAGPVRLRVYNVFKGWIESHWRNSSDAEALPAIKAFAQDKLSGLIPAAGRRLLELITKVTSADGTLVPRLVSSMGKTNTAINQYVSPDTPIPAPVLKKAQISLLRNWKMGGTSPSIMEFDPLELARQLTIKEMNIFCAIMPEELLASEWMKKQGSNATNVRAMSTLSTDLSNLVADTILQYDDPSKRAIIIKHWIKIAHRCLELNNYDSLMAIICSLNSSTIARLKKTWPLVSTKRKDMLKVLQDIVEPTKNHAVLRQRLQNHVPPCLPFVGTYLTDLTFVDIGNPATKQLPGVGDDKGIQVINFDKHSRTAKIIGELQRFQIPYRLQEVPEMQEWLQAQIIRVRESNDSNNVQQYYRKSLLLEPRAQVSGRPSPIEQQGAFASKEKFDIFGWAHSAREKNNESPAPLSAVSAMSQ